MKLPLSFPSALTFVVALAGCGGQSTVGSEGRPAPDPNAPTSAPVIAFTEAEVEAAIASCSAPHGDVQTYATVDELVSLLATRWIYCGGRKGEPLKDRDGVARLGYEFTADGHVYILARDPRTGVARGTGLAGAMTYDILPPTDAEYNNVSFQITVWTADRSQMGGYATFEQGPRRMTLTAFDGYFVPLERPTT